MNIDKSLIMRVMIGVGLLILSGNFLSASAQTSSPHLLLSELVVTPTGGEYIEIFNPTASLIDLSDVYLTDATFAGGSTFYYNIVTGTNAGGGGFSDFHARFPDGSSIGPGEHQTVALNGSDNFIVTYGVDPTYELFEDGVSADAIPDMREALPGSINNQGGLTNSGEVVILYTWDGASDLVADLDYALWGDKAEAVDKTGINIDGPDADATASAYLADTAIGSQDVIAGGGHAFGNSWQRDDPNEGLEVQAGGNGVTGHDETSEDLSNTWCEATPTPNAASDCPPPPPPPTVQVVINEIHADPASGAAGDANGDGVRDFSDDEFVEIVNNTGGILDLAGWTLSDGFSVRHTFPAGTLVQDQCALVVFGGGAPTGEFGGSFVQIASTGALGLNNGGDTVTLNDGATDQAVLIYSGEGGDNQSLTRDPDVIGLEPLVKHTTATGSGGALFSPGTKVDGSAFASDCVAFVEIFDIQAEAQSSPLAGQVIVTEDNIVTVTRPFGFYMQTPDARTDADADTSDGIFVFTNSAPAVAVGDSVDVIGTVSEFFPGGIGTGNLSTTQLSGQQVIVKSSGNPLPAATVIGAGGRIPPSEVIDDDGNTTYDPNSDGLDFYESLEGMLVQVNDAVVVGPNRFGEITVVGDNGANATGFNARGGITISDGDFNPERVIIDDSIVLSEPLVTVGDAFDAPVVGVMDYSFGNFKLLNFDPLPALVSGGLTNETAAAALDANKQLSVATFNVLNLDPNDTGQIPGLASQIVNNLLAPDIIGLQEIQDNNGSTNDGTVAANLTYEALIQAIQAAGGPLYEFRDIAPENLADGGQPGGNIRVGFLFNPARVTFVDGPGGDATTSTTAVAGADGVELTFSPGRIDPNNVAFSNSRKVLAGEFVFNGHKLIVVVGHFNSKGGDGPLFGSVQPPMLNSETQRLLQAQVVNDFVDSVLALDPDANVVVLGDLNDFQFSAPLDTLKGGADPVLTNLVDSLTDTDAYTFVFDGNSQALDHILVSDNILSAVADFDIVHGNAERNFTIQFSDHDPELTRLTLIEVLIDIKPDEAFNTINLNSHGNLTVAVLGAADFDATTVDPGTIELEGVGVRVKKNGKLQLSVDDVNADGFDDLVLHFPVAELADVLSEDSTEATLSGVVGSGPFAGGLVIGSDTVVIVPQVGACQAAFWLNNLDQWTAPNDPTDNVRAVFNIPNTLKAQGKLDLDGDGDEDTLADALGYDGSDAAETLLQEAVVSLLNASHPDLIFPLEDWEVIVEASDALAGSEGDMLDLAAELATYNLAGCPLG